MKIYNILILSALSALSIEASSQTVLNNINLPQAPQFNQGTDRIRASDGTECSRSTGPRRRYLDAGVVGGGWGGQGVENQYPIIYQNATTAPPNNYNRAGGAAYSRIVMNLDSDQDNFQIDCGRLYELELQRLKMEIGDAKTISNAKPVGVKN